MSMYKNYVNGEWVDGSDVNRDINPSNLDDVVGEYVRADAAQARSAIAAARASWVTITVVWPNSSTERRIRSRISPLVRESRLPVGSSANITVGRDTSARAIATRCC
jgi:aldehyde dehydrogenase (NAD+)